MKDKSQQAVKVYEKISQIYADKFDGHSFRIDNFIDLLPKGGKVLDVGCGPGADAGYLSSKGFSVEGVDLSDSMINIAQKKFPDVKFDRQDMRKLNYPKDNFDGLLVSFSLIHIPKVDVLETLKSFYKILKPNGIMYIGIQEGKSEEIYAVEPLNPTETLFLNIMSRSELKQLIKENGFHLLRHFGRKPLNKEEFNYTKYVVIASKPSGFSRDLNHS